jgi:hypothetical protein
MNFLKQLLGSRTGISSKRIIGLTSVIIIYIIAFVELFTGKTVSDYVFQGLIWLAIGGIFGIASERFADILTGNSSTNTNTTNPCDTKKTDGTKPPIEGVQ